MSKRMTLLATTIALATSAVPALAQAEPIVTDADGNDAIAITAEGTDVTFISPGGTFECGTHKLSLTGETGHYEGTGTAFGNSTTTPHEGPCGTSSGFAIDINSIKATVQLNGGGTGSASFEYTYTITTPLGSPRCTFKATGVPVTYTTTTSTISISEGRMEGFGPGCWTSVTLSGVFHVLDQNKEPTTIH